MEHDLLPDIPAPRTIADRLRDRVSAVIAASVAVATALKVWDDLGPNAAEIALAVENLLLMIAALVFAALGDKRDQAVKISQRAAAAAAFRRGLYAPVPSPDGRDRASDPERETAPIGLPPSLLAVLAVVGISVSAMACAHAPTGRDLGAVLGRVDVTRVLNCANLRPDWGMVAKCVGAEAATQGLQIAFDEAIKAIDKIPNPHAGAADLDPKAEAELAEELDEALGRLGAEIDASYSATIEP